MGETESTEIELRGLDRCGESAAGTVGGVVVAFGIPRFRVPNAAVPQGRMYGASP